MKRPFMVLVALAFGTVFLGSRNAPALKVVEYQIPRANAFPHDPAVGPDGVVWYTDQANSYIGRLDPTTGKFTDWPTPTPKSGPHGIVVAADGGVWYTGNAAGRIGRLDPKTGTIKEYALPEAAKDPHTPIFQGGKLWFTVQAGNIIGHLDPATGEVKLFHPRTNGAKPYGIVPVGKTDLWADLFGTNKLAHVVGTTGEIHEIDLPNAATRPRRIAVDHDDNVWYSDYSRGYLGFLGFPKGGKPVFKEWPSPSGADSQPYGMAIGPDGRIWYNESARGVNLMVAFNPATEKFETVPIPTPGAVVRHIAVDFERSRMWLALSGTGRIGRIDFGAAEKTP